MSKNIKNSGNSKNTTAPSTLAESTANIQVDVTESSADESAVLVEPSATASEEVIVENISVGDDVVVDASVEESVIEEAVVVENPIVSKTAFDADEYTLTVLRTQLTNYAVQMAPNVVVEHDVSVHSQTTIFKVIETWVRLHNKPTLFHKYSGILYAWFNENAEGCAHESRINRWLERLNVSSTAIRKHSDLISTVKRLADPKVRNMIANQPTQLTSSLKHVAPPEAFIALVIEGIRDGNLLK